MDNIKHRLYFQVKDKADIKIDRKIREDFNQGFWNQSYFQIRNQVWWRVCWSVINQIRDEIEELPNE